MEKVFKKIDAISEWTGKASSWFIILMMMIIIVDIVMRRLLSNPTIWGYEITYMLWGAYFILTCGWTEKMGGHLSVDVLSAKFSPKLKLWLDIIFYTVLCLFWVTTLVIGGTDFAIKSWIRNEHTQTPFAPPLYPLKTLLPVGFAILWLQCAAKLLRDIRTLLKKGE